MFSVPGWKVSAPLKAQREPTNKSQEEHSNGQNTQNTQNRPAAAPVTKHKVSKRKRTGTNGSELGANVTGANVSALWESVIEGKVSEKKTAGAGKAGSSAKRRRKNRDKQRQLGKERPTVDEGDEENQGGVSTKEAPGREIELRVKDQSQKKGRFAKGAEDDNHSPNNVAKSAAPSRLISSAPVETKLTPLQASMRAKLSSARFRHLNEKLYTTTSSTSLALFAESPAMFAEYHAGFRQQVSVWPENPVDGYMADIRIRGAIKLPINHRTAKSPTAKPEGPKSTVPLPRTHGTCIIADLGCGDAQLAQSLKGAQKLNLQIHSFDLHPANKYITKADISQLPLADGAVDVAIFCLALMGTNWPDFIDEAWRVLHWKGELWVAEIKSRFARPARATPGAVVEHSVGNRQRKLQGQHKGGVSSKKKTKEAEEAEERANEDALAVEVDEITAGSASGSTNVNAFVAALRKRGFVLDGDEASDAVDMRNKMFVKLRFVKSATPVRGKNAAAMAEAAAEQRQAGIIAGGDERFGSGRGGQTWQKKPVRKGSFLDPDDGGEDEGKILKPCVYKLR
jgi:ribosomal RNA-processing protein 8